ncbi:putative minor capsid protein [Listeria booriae]|uniref:putative minor capsid protein n=1 Tax=Listeria booriae TaxID=1552123 RepID=UPI00162AD571|nr:putative minor capsid protein [Listeria booriae]MBC2318781.1 minor capsid protein [Listeria booriae]
MRLKKKAKLTPPIPIDVLIHDVYYEALKDEKDSWGNPEYAEKILISHVRVDLNTVFSRDSTQKQVVADGIIFIDSTNSEGAPDKFVEESRITFDGKKYTLKKVIPCYKVESNEIRHWELEVI